MGVASSASNRPYYANQSLARYEKAVTRRALRDNIIKAFQSAFQDDTIQLLITDRWIKEPKIEECDRFFYTYQLPSDTENVERGVRSLYHFKTEQDARQDAEVLKTVGLIPEAYRLLNNTINHEETATFSFDIIYNPLVYNDYLTRITESPDVFNRRKEQFLNHLLARFAEQFTEYTLLMYALNGKANEQAEIISDKSRFLSCYPHTSRNRGKGYNYSDVQNLWNTDNVSGFEQRVAGFMGIDNWQRRTLNYFKLAIDDNVIQWQWKDKLYDNLIFKSNYILAKDYKEDCATFLSSILSNPTHHFAKKDCDTEGAYSFQFEDGSGNTLLHHIPVYATSEERNAALFFWESVFNKKKNATARTEAVIIAKELRDRFIFIFKNAETETVLLKSLNTFSTEEKAKVAFYKALQVAQKAANYVHSKKIPFYFTLKNEIGESIAEHPMRYESKGDSLEAQHILFQQVTQAWATFSIVPTEPTIRWRIGDGVGGSLLEGVIEFKKYDDESIQSLNAQPYYAFLEALNTVRQDNALNIVQEDNDQFSIALMQSDTPSRLFLDWNLLGLPQNWIKVGQASGRYKTFDEANIALAALKDVLSKPTLIEQAVYKDADGRFRFNLISLDDAYPVMVSREAYDTHVEALLAYAQFIELATDFEQYKTMTLDSDKRFYIQKDNIHVVSNQAYPITELNEALTAAMQDTHAKVVQHKAQLIPITEGPRQYHIEILDKDNTDNIWLVGTEKYDSETVAYQNVERFLSALSKGLTKTEETLVDGDKLYGFHVEEKGVTIAVHPESYLKQEDRDAVFDKIIQLRGNTEGAIIPDIKYKYAIRQADCSWAIKDLYVSDELYESSEQAIEAGEIFAAAPPKGNQKGLDDKTIQYIKSPLACEKNELKVPQLSDAPKLKLIEGTRYRLRDDEYNIAYFNQCFETKEKRDAALEDFWSYWQTASKTFPQIGIITFDTLNIKKAKPKKQEDISCFDKNTVEGIYFFKFDFECGAARYTLRSGKLYGSADDAFADNTPKLVDTIALLTDYDAYRIETSGNKYVLNIYDYLKPIGFNIKEDTVERPVFQVTTIFNKEKDARIAMKNLMTWAQMYPFYKDDKGAIRFRIRHAETLDTLFLSTQAYATREAACTGFEALLRLLLYPANVMSLDDPLTFVVGEILLEANDEYKKRERAFCRETLKLSNTEGVWDTDLTLLLKSINEPYGVRMVYAPEESGGGTCRYGFRVVDKDYSMALHPIIYENAIQRSRAKQQLWALHHCQKACAPNTADIKKIKKETQKEVELWVITLDGITWTIQSDFDIKDLLWDLRDKNEKDETIKLDIEKKLWLYFTTWAEHEAFYETGIVKEPVGSTFVTKYALRLMDEDGVEIAVSNAFATEQERDAARIETILQAREYPIKVIRPTRKNEAIAYQCRIYCREWQNVVPSSDIPTIKGAYIWEAVQTQFYLYDASNYLKSMSNSLLSFDNFEDIQEDNCGGFGIELTDKNHIVAYYPDSFGSRQDTQKGIERMLKLVNTEGYHVIEHILLRPKTEAIELLPLNAEYASKWEEMEKPFKAYLGKLATDGRIDENEFNIRKAIYKKELPGKDPYSAQVTIVLPYWAKRFQNDRFRAFFQNTLRRELPAHCVLTPVWLSPKDMCDFEFKYHNWLTAMAAGSTQSETNALIDQLKKQKTVFPDAVLGGQGVSTGVLLDDMRLT
jgi:uncharacterized protein YegP (UPF0339 family)